MEHRLPGERISNLSHLSLPRGGRSLDKGPSAPSLPRLPRFILSLQVCCLCMVWTETCATESTARHAFLSPLPESSHLSSGPKELDQCSSGQWTPGQIFRIGVLIFNCYRWQAAAISYSLPFYLELKFNFLNFMKRNEKYAGGKSETRESFWTSKIF